MEEGQPTSSDYGFRNIKPLTRLERRAMKDKVALEKHRLINRAGKAARQYRDNLPPEGVSLTELQSGAAGFIADADRFHSDVVGEEYLRRQAQFEKKQQVNLVRRNQKLDRERERWDGMQKKVHDEEEHWKGVRAQEDSAKAKKNESGVPYNMISLRYNDGKEGERLKYSDDMVKYRATLRSNNLNKLGDSRCGYNILTGEPKHDPNPPSRPSLGGS